MLAVVAQTLWFLAGVTTAASGSGAVFVDVPFVRQTGNGCGAACIAMVLGYWDAKCSGIPRSRSEADIFRALYSDADKGIHASAMIQYFQAQGYRTFQLKGDYDALVHHVSKGRPLIGALKEDAGKPVFHYVVIAGIDRGGNFVLLNDPARRKLVKVTRADFEKAWSVTNNWTLLVVPNKCVDNLR